MVENGVFSASLKDWEALVSYESTCAIGVKGTLIVHNPNKKEFHVTLRTLLPVYCDVAVCYTVDCEYGQPKGDSAMPCDKIEIGLPEKIEMIQHGTHVELVQRWFGFRFIFTTLFVIFWDVTLINQYLNVEIDQNLMSLISSLPLIHIAAGIGLSYYTLAGWLNSTHTLISKTAIEVRSGPLPWLGNKQIPSTDVKQLYAKETGSSFRQGSSATYDVHVITKNGKNVKLLSGLDTSEQALYIEQQIEKYLGIENTSIQGEIGNDSD